MKKIYVILLAFLALNTSAQVASCSISPLLNKAGIWPDSATNFLTGYVGQAYNQNITIKVSKDTTGFCFTRFELSNPGTVTNFDCPPGLTLLAGPTLTNSGGVYKIPANAASCAQISGTPTAVGSYTLKFRVQAFGTPNFGSCPNQPVYNNGIAISSQTLTYYIINILNTPTNIKESIDFKSLGLNATPNPANAKTNLKFNVGDESVAKISIYNLLGEKINEEEFKTKVGENSFELKTENWPNGVYLYSVQYKNFTQTKRLIISGNK